MSPDEVRGVDEIFARLHGVCSPQDHLWRITTPDGVRAYIAEYNEEVVGYDPILGARHPLIVRYGASAHYILEEFARAHGWRVEALT